MNPTAKAILIGPASEASAQIDRRTSSRIMAYPDGIQRVQRQARARAVSLMIPAPSSAAAAIFALPTALSAASATKAVPKKSIAPSVCGGSLPWLTRRARLSQIAAVGTGKAVLGNS